MNNYLTQYQTVKAEPMTQGEAIRSGIHQSFIESTTKDEEGYRVILFDNYSTWIPKEVFEKHYSKIDDEEDIIHLTMRAKNRILLNTLSMMNSSQMYKDESVSSNASMFLAYFHAVKDYLHLMRFRNTAEEKANEVRMEGLSFYEADSLMTEGFAVMSQSWIQNQYFIIKQQKTYHPSYFANNERFPVNQVILKVMGELSETCTADNAGTYRMVDINTGYNLKWDGSLADVQGCWKVIY